jgi:methyl-accepting chemotaxis protein
VASENDTISKLVLLGRALAIALSLLALLLGFAIATLFSRSILRSIGATSLAIREIVAEDIATLTLTLKRLAKGDLTGRFASSRALLAVKGSDEIGTLTETYNSLAEALAEMAHQYTAATDNLRILISGVAMTSNRWQ